MKKIALTSLILLYTLISYPSQDASAFWVWTPKSEKFVNPKHAAKDSPKKQFKWAMKLFAQKKYKRAAEEFERLVKNFKDSALAPEAQYYAGMSYEKAGKYYPAFNAYQKAMEVYPFTKRIDEIIEREFSLGKMFYTRNSGKLMGVELMTDLERAVEVFDRVRKNAPFGKYAAPAQLMIGKCHKKGQMYNDAVEAFQKVVDEYPEHKSVEEAKYEVAQCTYLASLKSDYDQEMTDEAIREFKYFAGDGSKWSELKKSARSTLTLLEEKKAESVFKIAKFYQRQKRYTSAAVYYREVLEKYPHSSMRISAAKNLEDIAKFLNKAQ